MDELQPYELSSIVNYVSYLDKNERETDRIKLYLAAQPNMKHKIDIKKDYPLPWDNDDTVRWTDEYKEQVNEERKSAAERMREIEKMLNQTS